MKKKTEIVTCSGYLTVYLTLVMTVMLSLCLALIEGARSNGIRVETECVMEIGLNSILAEYHQELSEQYNLFAIDSSYGTSVSGVAEVEQHLLRYMNRNFTLEDIFLSQYIYKDFLAISAEAAEMTKGRILTDKKGTVFRRRAVEAMRDDCNLTLLSQLQSWMTVVEDNGLQSRNVAAEKRAVDQQIAAYNGQEIQISEQEWTVIEVQNPTEGLEEIRDSGVLEFVIEDTDALSTKSIDDRGLIFSRMSQEQINQGNLPVSDISDEEILLERFFFQEYLLRYLGHYGEEKEDGALSYQIEYLLANHEADVKNLKQVASMICAIREASNVIYLYSDEQKCAEAELVATLITAIFQVPELSGLLKTALLLGWAYAESLYDVEVLLQGGKVPLIKNQSDWHYDMESALQFDDNDGSLPDKGLCYEDYLRIMMMFVDIDTLTGRAMNMVEADIRLSPGNERFRLDNCYDCVEFCVQVKSKYGYEYEITRQKKY
uniref:DUF5702 domain-containing protein n=1 Tax=Acetatifactor sp. TaxID=1872090 RepID=UPI004057BE51